MLTLLLAAAACTPSPRSASAPPPARIVPAAPPPVRPAADWRDWPVTPGDWHYTADARGSVAMFGQGGAEALAVLRCDRAGGRLFLSVAGAAGGALTVRTSSVARTLPAAPTGGTPAYAAAALTPNDPLLDALAFSRGRFALRLADAAPVVLPAWAEVGRVVEDCRT